MERLGYLIVPKKGIRAIINYYFFESTLKNKNTVAFHLELLSETRIMDLYPWVR